MEETPLPSLQFDTLAHVFHKLPLRSVLQCKLVCKEWCSLISSPFFKSTYNPANIPNHPLNLIVIPRSIDSYPRHRREHSALRYEIEGSRNPPITHPQSLPGGFNAGDRIAVLGSWNGLVSLHRDPGDFCLFNPCTGEEMLVHTEIDGEENVNRWAQNLYGLCHDHLSGEYKAVQLFSRFGYDYLAFHVVNFKDGSCMSKTQSIDSGLGCLHGRRGNLGTIVKDVPHWICERYLETLIVYFNPQMEEFERTQLPAVCGDSVCGLGALNGQLTVVVESSAMGGRGMEVWAMNKHDNEKSWSKLFVIVNNLYAASLLSWLDDDEILIDVNEGAVMRYNLRDQTLRRLRWKMHRSSYSIITYIPSLVSPNQ